MRRKKVQMMLAAMSGALLLGGAVSVSAESSQEASSAAAAETAEETAEETAGEEESLKGLAGELVDGLFGEDSPLKDYVGSDSAAAGYLNSLVDSLTDPEGEAAKAVDSILEEIKEDSMQTYELISAIQEIGGEDGGPASLLGNILAGFLNEDGSISLERVREMAQALAGSGSSLLGSDSDASSVEDMVREAAQNGGFLSDDPVNQAVRDYIQEMNKDNYDKADVTLVLIDPSSTLYDESDGTTVRLFGDFITDNFKKDGDRLVFESGGTDTGIVTVKSEDGENFTVADAKFAGDGSRFPEDVRAFCEEMDYDPDEYFGKDGKSGRACLLESFLDYAGKDGSVTTLVMNDGTETSCDEAVEELVSYYTDLFSQLSEADAADPAEGEAAEGEAAGEEAEEESAE